MDHSPSDLLFPFVSSKAVDCRFDAGEVSSDAGLLLLARADQRLGLTEKLATQILDRRQQSKVVHSVLDLLRTRIYAIAAGYEDANDLTHLKTDPALLVACGKRIALGQALASQPTISRFENSVDSKDLLCLGLALAELVIGALPHNTASVVLDVDATDDPCHGEQEAERFNGYYDAHCYVPLLVHICAEDGRQRLLTALLRAGNAASKVGLFGLLGRAVALLRERFPDVAITLRADSGFGEGEVLAFCEAQGISFVLGLSSNSRLRARSLGLEQRVLEKTERTRKDQRRYTAFFYQADSWQRAQRVVCKVETVRAKLNVRYLLTDQTQKAQDVYQFYCARGDQENRIKELKIDLNSGRTSCHRFLANQLRLLLHVAACVLFTAVQEALAGTQWARAQIGTLRLQLIKVGARVISSHRRIRFHLPTSYAWQGMWQHLFVRLGPVFT